MIYQCTEKDRSRILDYIAKEPEMNLFIFGDIENFGVAKDPVWIRVLTNPDGSWNALLLQFFDNFVLYSQNADYDAAAAAEFLKQQKPSCISGKLELLKPLAPYFPDKDLEPTYMSRCNKVNPDAVHPLPADVTVREMTPPDFKELSELLCKIEEFAKTYTNPEKSKKEKLINYEHGSHTYGVYRNGKLLATAATTADNSQSAMIVSVATLPGERGHGFATAAVAKLCANCFASGMHFLCLFYDNPAAGRIYRRIGFEELGQYAMLH